MAMVEAMFMVLATAILAAMAMVATVVVVEAAPSGPSRITF